MTETPEKIFENHICAYLEGMHGYAPLSNADIADREFYFIESDLIAFIKATQNETFDGFQKEYGLDAPAEIMRALKDELKLKPLWLIIRDGLDVRGKHFKLYAPKPRSGLSGSALKDYGNNKISFRQQFYIMNGESIDIVLYLNGLPIITIELKHEKAGQNVHDATRQYTLRNHNDRIFQLPFLHIAADTSDVKVATDPRFEEGFRWFNQGLVNTPSQEGEYPVDYLYADALSKDRILEYLSFYLVYAPPPQGESSPAKTIFPRYHQSRTVEKLATNLQSQYSATGILGKKYLINHSAGSGKTLTISWTADRLQSLYKPGTGDKVVNMIFILTDRIDLDSNIRKDMKNFAHLSKVVKYADDSGDLAKFIKDREQIIVTTQQKFKYIQDEINSDPELRKLKVAFLIDEAHRSQEGRMAANVRAPFHNPDESDDDVEPPSEEDETTEAISKVNNDNQTFVAFTATPSQSTTTLFGEPFDIYSEAEAIQEGYILDVASSIISFSTLYNLHSTYVPTPGEEKYYPKGVVAKALKTIAFQDEGLIQYKSEVMLRMFQDQISGLIAGRAKAMVVTSSRRAGLLYFNILKEKIREKGLPYKILYAFSDFEDPTTGKTITETSINGLEPNEKIEDRFKGEDYRIIVVANKFQTGFDEPLLAGMFLDKAVFDKNAVQTLSRLNRCFPGKDKTVVVDFTNNTKEIFKAFIKYRKGTPYEPGEPDPIKLQQLYDEISAYGVFDDSDVVNLLGHIAAGNDAEVMSLCAEYRQRFNDKLVDAESRKKYVLLMHKYVRLYNFLTAFYTFESKLAEFSTFASVVAPTLIKIGTVSTLLEELKHVDLTKASVKYEGEKYIPAEERKSKGGRKGGPGTEPPKATIQEMIEDIRQKFQISEEEAIFIREVCEEKSQDQAVVATIQAHKEDKTYLQNDYAKDLRALVTDAYFQRGLFEQIADPKYHETGAIFDIMSQVIIWRGLEVKTAP